MFIRNNIKGVLDRSLKIKDLRILKYFLGLKVTHSKEDIFISQRKYYLDLLKHLYPLASKPILTPLNPTIKLHQDEKKPYEDITIYTRLIGMSLYINNTTPDITLTTQQLSQFLHTQKN